MCCFRKLMSLQALWLCVVITYAVIEVTTACYNPVDSLVTGTTGVLLSTLSVAVTLTQGATLPSATNFSTPTPSVQQNETQSLGLCHIFNRYDCEANAKFNGVPKELEPSCYPTIQQCESNYCSNVFGRVKDVANNITSFPDGWNGDILFSECGVEEYLDERDIDQCKYALVGYYDEERNITEGLPYDYNRCTCQGLLCNRYTKDGMVFKYNQSTTVSNPTGAQATFPAGTSMPPLAGASDTSTTNEFTTSAAGTTATEKDKSNFSGLCYIFNRYVCKDNSIIHKISKELEPSCYPKIERCKSNHCANVFNRMSNDDNPYGVLRDGWNGDILWSECAIDTYFNPEKNDVNQCKNATAGTYNALRYIKDGHSRKPPLGTPYDYNKCTCKGLLCNSYSPEGMIYRYNQYRTIGPIPTNTAETVFVVSKSDEPSPNWKEAFLATLGVALVILLPLCALSMCLGVRVHGKCVNSIKKTSTIESSDPGSASLQSSNGGEKFYPNLELTKLTSLTKGRYGNLFLLNDANHNGQQVVAKVYNLVDEHFWAHEVEIYKHPGMSHETVVRFFGADQHRSDLFIFLQYHSNGSLRDYLKGHRVSWSEMMKIMYTMARGLAHLHESLVLPPDSRIKHPIGHRDIKSTNIILDDNLNAKIADFNLAQILDRCLLDEAVNQERVGTIRYMAPEILSGQISYTRQAILQGDVYAMSLVMWEVFSRCDVNTLGSAEYRQPYYEYIGDAPTPEDMYQVVFVNNKRPSFSSELASPIVQEVISTIRDGWDKDGETRLTASCIEMRLREFISSGDSESYDNTSYV